MTSGEMGGRRNNRTVITTEKIPNATKTPSITFAYSISSGLAFMGVILTPRNRVGQQNWRIVRRKIPIPLIEGF